jgi:hypothetical protein
MAETRFCDVESTGAEGRSSDQIEDALVTLLIL